MPPLINMIKLRVDHFASIGTVPSLDFASIPLPFVSETAQRARRVTLFTSIICDSSLPLPAARFSFSSVLLFALDHSMPLRAYNVKGKPAGRKFITSEQQIITEKADFSEQLRGRKRVHGTTLWFAR